MKLKIGIFGSDLDNLEDIIPKAKALGKILGKYSDSVTVITGASTGLPYIVAKEAAANGTEVWGYSPHLDKASFEVAMPDHDLSIYTKIIYVPKNFVYANDLNVRKKYRNVISTASCDAGIVIAGRWGTLNEFTNLIDMQKVIGIWNGTGGISDELPKLLSKISKQGQGQTIIENDPQKLVKKILLNFNFIYL